MSQARMKPHHLSRRGALKALAAVGGATAVGGVSLGRTRPARADTGAKFLIVIPAFGGGAIVDSVLPIKQSESANANTIDCFPDEDVVDIAGSPFRVADARIRSIVGIEVDEYQVVLSEMIAKHRADLMVTTHTGSSVNHAVAQKRSLTGGGAWNGRTLQELVAVKYGEGYALPNVNMSRMGYLENGDDGSLPSRCFAEPIAQPLTKPLSLSARKGTAKGMKGVPSAELLERARAIRNDQIDPESAFYRAFRNSPELLLWMNQRSVAGPAIEQQNLIDKLFFAPEIEGVLPLSDYGLSPAPEAEQLLTVFPDMFGQNQDLFEQQAALAYLLIKNKVSTTVTLSPDFTTVVGGPFGLKVPPLAFDGSHQDHRAAQAIMWHRILSVTDRLIDLLKTTPYDADTGESFWDRTMIYIPTDFGRNKARPYGAEIWGTGHDLNNGTLCFSPMVNGNTVLGGVDPHTAMTYGFDLSTGAPDPGRNTTEAEVFSGLLQALDIDTSEAGLPAVAAMRRNG